MFRRSSQTLTSMKPKWKPLLPKVVGSHLAARKRGSLGRLFCFLAENAISSKPIPFVPCLGGSFCFAFFASSRFASGLSPCEFLASIADHKLPVSAS
jgi:hypothetical protein